MTASSGKLLEDISHAQMVSSMYKLKTSAIDSDDLSIGFNRDRNRRRGEFPNNKNINENFHVRIMLKDVFGYAEHREKATCGLGYKLT